MEKSGRSLLSDILRVTSIFLIAVVLLLIISFFVLRAIVRGNEVEVPNLIGKSFAEASEILRERGLRTLQIEGRKYSAKLPKDHVVEQRPLPKQKVKTGREIKVFLSRGTEAGRVPRITGQYVLEAESILESAGLEVGSITRIHSDDFPQEGVIVAHTPPANVTVQRGSGVNLLVSLGPHSVQLTMPNLEGMKLESALETLEFGGLRKGRITRKASPVVEGIVLEQVPQPDDRVERGAIVDLVVSSSSGASEATSRTVILSYKVPPRPRDPQIQDPIQEDTSPRYVEIVVEHEGGVRTIDGVFPPGRSLQYPLQIEGSGVAKIYVDDMLMETMICSLRSKVFVSQ